MPLFLGLDASTQSLSAVVVDTENGAVVLDTGVSFGADLAAFGCPNGFIPNDDPLLRQSDPLMWVEAVDLLFERCRDQGLDFSAIRGVSGSGQQHGSVYLNKDFLKGLCLKRSGRLAEQVKPLLSRKTAPIWMDSSTSRECEEIGAAAGGADQVSRISGSRPIERFTGPQIRKFAKDDPEAYSKTARIHLVSSFIASLLCGKDAAIDFGDGAGMNLLDLEKGDWSEPLLSATAEGLRERLPRAVPGGTRIGEIDPYFEEKYGFSRDTPVFAFSGDNPCSLVGMGATTPGVAVISLGTSDTFFGAMEKPVTDPKGYGHVFGNPAGGFMCLMCITNGSLAREAVMEKAGLDHAGFEDAILNQTTAGAGGNLMLPYFETETTPLVLEAGARLFGSDAFVKWQSPAEAARAIVEAQAISLKMHTGWTGKPPERIRVTGGASQNNGILQVIADVFGAELVRLKVTNSAGLGAALMAAQAGTGTEWEELFEAFSTPAPGVVVPNREVAGVYEDLAGTFRARLKECYGIA